MTYERFLRITMGLKKQHEEIQELYRRNIDLIEFVEPYDKSISELMIEVYGEEGYDWWSFFCYETDFGTKGIRAWDENKNPICYSYESTWEFLEKLRTSKS